MQLVKTVSVLALATGAVVAMPANVENAGLAKRQWWGGNRFWQRPNPTAEITVTGYAPEPTGGWYSEAPTSTTTSTTTAAPTTSTTSDVVVSATPATDSNFGGFYNRPSQDFTPTEAPSTPTSAPETPASSASAPAATSASSDSSLYDYMSVVSKWRAAGGLPALTQDSQLEANAMKTSTDSVGGLIHELNPGTMAQVLAPGTPDNFESVYVGGWLCEIPTLPGLNGICATEAQGWDHSNGETGHAEILTSTSYSKIGCALALSTGVWACDLA
ncbi:uncharacterized protein PV07_11093 [Cladophialophora immunda]|uniref:SCP domain-containing protein n=1 Tax=Cladophialophora immunda TaxID=569365 RepID=A0A0D2BWU2_9EURO|nr:uncharacterized protein PV07_11093 [Cladophialophora immunda]KIW22835.1 hypothetical protein PV07_11093 [Cladophialophora immunda]OQU93903.1 hypothetical protein CLAIMM_00353 isoform 1 [Cladophialophora immunda]OQU93904.1 hypothetical protein CLAIMM_00353 isoform 2 [Cladophialophora immunda]